MPDCNKQTANALTRLCIDEVESECPYLPLSNYLFYLIETAMMEERRCIAFSASFRCIDVSSDWKDYCYCWGVWHIPFVKGNSYFGSPRK